MKNKKTNNNEVKNIEVKKEASLLKDAVSLFLITLVSGLALSYVYEITKAPIAEQAVLAAEAANKAVFESAESFEPADDLLALIESTDLVSLDANYKGVTIDDVKKALDETGEVIGYNITVSTTSGYKDKITIVIGYSNEGEILGIKILTITETAGLGMKAKEPEFTDQYISKTVDKFVVTKIGAAADNEIDAISGATITSSAVTNAINAGIGFIAENADLGGGQ
ncbi:MAG: FMN-binding protein [Mobilitalea sp.]